MTVENRHEGWYKYKPAGKHKWLVPSRRNMNVCLCTTFERSVPERGLETYNSSSYNPKLNLTEVPLSNSFVPNHSSSKSLKSYMLAVHRTSRTSTVFDLKSLAEILVEVPNPGMEENRLRRLR